MTKFPKMVEILAPGESGDAKISHVSVTREDSLRTCLRPREYVSEGQYVQLHVNGVLMMSDTRHEHITNYTVVSKARGQVFIAGLGVGMICHAIADKSEVDRIVVIEKSQGVIDLVGPTMPAKVEVIQGDVFEFKAAKGTKFDTIYFDIWPFITTDNLPEMGRLHRRFRKYLAKDGWMQSWCRDRLKSQLRQERRMFPV